MARTRSKPAAKELTSPPTTSTPKPLPPSVENAPKLFVLPKDTSKGARIVSLDNPATGAPSRYLFCPDKGFHEFTKIAAPKKACRSWLITSEKSLNENDVGLDQDSIQFGTGYISKSADLFIATPFDILFLILPALLPETAKETKRLYLCLDDYLDKLSSSSSHWRALIAQYPTLKNRIEERISQFCDTVDAGDEKMYRLSNNKLLEVLFQKAERICSKGLPASMEEKFIKPVLDIPIMNIKRDESSLGPTPEALSVQTEDSQCSSISSTTADSQTTEESVSTVAASVDSVEEVKPALTTPPDVPNLLRLRTALNYILSSYLSPLHSSSLQSLIDSQPSTLSIPDFTLLTTHLATVAKLKAEAAAMRSMLDNISVKRQLDDDEEKITEREEKKRRKEEEEKRKKNESRGVKQLKKVDTSASIDSAKTARFQ
ncbi:hypothetical protein CC78DRAFT_565797 [Lojkania enalia]|uniref:Ribonuclease H2 subunit B n=1 Tax=Lojkania enalia TaxID=147567 RepID=A0A9P4KHA4_9PLEO|nr:hypothetical protein CC78DRAFT_565797 [Didymosphaeria enalia]